jgi:DNA-binding transcriptional ArsR family regulator
MSSAGVADLDGAFAALADPTRRAVIRALLRKPLRAGELAARVEMSPPALSRHLRVLREAGLIIEESIEADARVRVYTLHVHAFAPVKDWLAQVDELWREQLQALKERAERSRRTRKVS